MLATDYAALRISPKIGATSAMPVTLHRSGRCVRPRGSGRPGEGTRLESERADDLRGIGATDVAEKERLRRPFRTHSRTHIIAGLGLAQESISRFLSMNRSSEPFMGQI
jgi:hypothetical protein